MATTLDDIAALLRENNELLRSMAAPALPCEAPHISTTDYLKIANAAQVFADASRAKKRKKEAAL